MKLCRVKKQHNEGYTDEENDQLSNKQPINIRDHHLDSENKDYYICTMENVTLQPSKSVYLDLLQNGIEANRHTQQQKFVKSCIRTDWQSTKYTVKIGRLQGSLTVLNLDLDCKQFYNGAYEQGNFGTVFDYGIQKQELVIKIITIKSQDELEDGLKEVFFNKIASALKVGPKFSSIFGYDALISQNGLQFAMQKCQTSSLFKNTHNAKTDLMGCLKVLHFLQLCHLDIKLSNIGWSPSYNKFVLLDFGLSRYVRQPIGKRSKTRFVGTFGYASPQMKKCYILKNHGFVDLYYNDLYCLESVISQIEGRQLQYVLQLQGGEKQNVIDQINSSLHLYTKLKYYLFTKEYKFLYQLIADYALPLTFKKLLTIQMKKAQDDQLQSIFEQVSKNASECLTIKEADFYFLNYTFKKQSRQLLDHAFLNLVEASESDFGLFQKYWRNPQQMTNMFYFIDVYSKSSTSFKEPRLKLINKIHSKIHSEGQSLSMFLKFRNVLLYYFDYFKSANNVQNMAKVQSYFVLFGESAKQDKMEVEILSFYKQKNTTEYVVKNIQYFLGKMLLIRFSNYYYESNNIQNLECLLLDSTLQSAERCFISDTVELMKIVELKFRLLKIQQTSQSKLSELKYRQYISKHENNINYCIKQILQCFLVESQIRSQKSWGSNCQSQYLINCMTKASILFFYKVDQHSYIQNMFSTEPLLSEHKTILSLLDKDMPLTLKQQICLDYKEIIEQNLFILSQPSLQEFARIAKLTNTFKFSDQYVGNFRLDKVSKIQECLIVGNHFYRILIFILALKRLDFSQTQFLSTIDNIQSFFKFISHFVGSIQLNDFFDPNSKQQALQIINENYLNLQKNQIKKELLYLLIACSSMLFWLKGFQKEAIQRLTSFILYDSQLTFMIKLCLNFFQQYKKDMRLVQDASLKIFLHAIRNKRYDMLWLNKRIIIASMPKFISTFPQDEVTNFLVNLSAYLQEKKENISLLNLFEFIDSLVDCFSAEESIITLQKYFMSQKLNRFVNCSLALIIFFHLYLKAGKNLSYALSQKILRFCIYFSGTLKKGLFQAYKVKLKAQHSALTKQVKIRKKCQRQPRPKDQSKEESPRQALSISWYKNFENGRKLKCTLELLSLSQRDQEYKNTFKAYDLVKRYIFKNQIGIYCLKFNYIVLEAEYQIIFNSTFYKIQYFNLMRKRKKESFTGLHDFEEVYLNLHHIKIKQEQSFYDISSKQIMIKFIQSIQYTCFKQFYNSIKFSQSFKKIEGKTEEWIITFSKVQNKINTSYLNALP